MVSPAAHLTLEPGGRGAVEHHGDAGAFRCVVDGQLDEHTHELRDGEAVSRREVKRPILLVGREPHVYALAASAHRRSLSSGQVLRGHLPPRGTGHPPPQRQRPEGRDARSQGGTHGNAGVAAADPSSMRTPCVYDIGSLLPFGLYHETARNRAVPWYVLNRTVRRHQPYTVSELEQYKKRCSKISQSQKQSAQRGFALYEICGLIIQTAMHAHVQKKIYSKDSLWLQVFKTNSRQRNHLVLHP